MEFQRALVVAARFPPGAWTASATTISHFSETALNVFQHPPLIAPQPLGRKWRCREGGAWPGTCSLLPGSFLAPEAVSNREQNGQGLARVPSVSIACLPSASSDPGPNAATEIIARSICSRVR